MSEAWDLFGEGNGAGSLAEMQARVGRYRRQPIGPREDPLIGCIVVRDTRFFGVSKVAEPPPNFAPNIVQGKSYDLAEPLAAGYFTDLLHRLLHVPVEIDVSQPWHQPGPVYGDPRLAPRRLGQKAFQAVVLGAYDRRCAITGERREFLEWHLGEVFKAS